MKQLQCNLIVTYLESYQANHLLTCVISLREREALHSAYVLGTWGQRTMFILGSLESQRRRLNKIWPPARGLTLHNKRFTIEKIY